MYFALSILSPPLENKARGGFPGARHASPSLPPRVTEGTARANLRLGSQVSWLGERGGLSKLISIPSRTLSNPPATEILASLPLAWGRNAGEEIAGRGNGPRGAWSHPRFPCRASLPRRWGRVCPLFCSQIPGRAKEEPSGPPRPRAGLQRWGLLSEHRPRGREAEDEGFGKADGQPERPRRLLVGFLTFRRAPGVPRGHGGTRGQSPAPARSWCETSRTHPATYTPWAGLPPRGDQFEFEKLNSLLSLYPGSSESTLSPWPQQRDTRKSNLRLRPAGNQGPGLGAGGAVLSREGGVGGSFRSRGTHTHGTPGLCSALPEPTAAPWRARPRTALPPPAGTGGHTHTRRRWGPPQSGSSFPPTEGEQRSPPLWNTGNVFPGKLLSLGCCFGGWGGGRGSRQGLAGASPLEPPTSRVRGKGAEGPAP